MPHKSRKRKRRPEHDDSRVIDESCVRQHMRNSRQIIQPPFGFPSAAFSLVSTRCAVGSSKSMVSIAFESESAKNGVPTLALREILLALEEPPQASASAAYVTTNAKDGTHRILWPYAKHRPLPPLRSSYHACSSSTAGPKAWVYQVLSVMAYFHARGQPFGNIFVPGMLLKGSITDETRISVSARCKRVTRAMPSPLCLFANQIMRLGNEFSFSKGTVSLMPPEVLLGSRALRLPTGDMWSLACLMYSLFLSGDQHLAGSPLFHDADSHSRFSHLMRIFRCTGTPNENTWPGVTQLSYFDSSMPVWEPDWSCLDRVNEQAFPGIRNMLRALLVSCPSNRLKARDMLQHPFFDDIRNSLPGNTPPSPLSAGSILQPLLRREAVQRKRLTLLLRRYPDDHRVSFGRSRSRVIDWLVGVARDRGISDDALFLADALLNRALICAPVDRSNIQAIAGACLSIAAKSVDTVTLSLAELNLMYQNRYPEQNLAEMEQCLLKIFEYNIITLISPLHFLRVCMAEARASSHTRHLARRLVHLHMLHGHPLLYRPSSIALSAAALALTGACVGPSISGALPSEMRSLPSNVQVLHSTSCTTALYNIWVNDTGLSRTPSTHVRAKFACRDMGRVSRLRPRHIQAKRVAAIYRLHGSRKDPVRVLPKAVMLHTLRYLGQVDLCAAARASKEWKRLCYDPSVGGTSWDFHPHKETMHAKHITGGLVQRMCNVKHLCLSQCALPVDAVRTILKKCRKLQRINLSYTRRGPTWPRAEDAGICCTLPPDLECINLCGSALFSKDDVIGMVRGAGGRVRALDLSSMLCVTDRTATALAESKMSRSLRTLKINMCLNVTDAFLCTLSRGCGGIEELYLDQCTDISNRGIISVVKHCAALRVLSVGYTRIGDPSLYSISHRCPNLEALYAPYCLHCTSDGIQRLLEACSQIKRLNLAFIESVSDRSLRPISHCKRLQELHLNGCTEITGRSIVAIRKSCGQTLQYLNLHGCNHIPIVALGLLKNRNPNMHIIFDRPNLHTFVSKRQIQPRHVIDIVYSDTYKVRQTEICFVDRSNAFLFRVSLFVCTRPTVVLYSDRCDFSRTQDSSHMYRHVIIPFSIKRRLPKDQRLMSDSEWRMLGIQQSLGWYHYGYYPREPNILLFKKVIVEDPTSAEVDPFHAAMQRIFNMQ